MSKAPWKPHPHSIARDGSLSPNAHRVWSVIRSHENRQGEAHISNDTIAKEAGMNERTVRRSKKELTERKMLETPFKPKGRGQGSCTYKTKEGCLKAPTKEISSAVEKILKTEITPEWEERQHRKHSCFGCGSCHECRTAESKYQQELRDIGF